MTYQWSSRFLEWIRGQDRTLFSTAFEIGKDNYTDALEYRDDSLCPLTFYKVVPKKMYNDDYE